MAWSVIEASKRAQEYFQNHDQVEIAIRLANGSYAPAERVHMEWIEDVKEKVPNSDAIRKLIRKSNQNTAQLNQVITKLDQVFKPMQNIQILSILNTALSAASLVATIAGMVIICNKLNNIDRKLDEIQKEIADVKEINFELQISKPCRKLMDDYRLLAPQISKGQYVSESKLIELIRECKDYIISLYNLRNNLPLEAVLNLIFMLLPVLANCMMVYYQRFYDPNQGKHLLHDSFMSVFDMLSSTSFIDQIQDYMFIDKHLTNKQVNEYLDCQRLIVYSYKQQIEQLLEDLKTCGSAEVYEDIMQWSRQYAAQQGKAVQIELENKYGAEKAEQIMSQARLEMEV